jgi:hypothetical protein
MHSKVFPGVKRSGRYLDQSLASNAKVNNVWTYTSTVQIFLHGVEWEDCIFYLLYSVISINAAVRASQLASQDLKCYALGEYNLRRSH